MICEDLSFPSNSQELQTAMLIPCRHRIPTTRFEKLDRFKSQGCTFHQRRAEWQVAVTNGLSDAST